MWAQFAVLGQVLVGRFNRGAASPRARVRMSMLGLSKVLL